MRLKDYALKKLQKTKIGSRLIEDKRYRVIAKAVFSLIFNLLFSFYNAFLGFLSSSLIFIVSAAYYLLLSAMRFSAVLLNRKNSPQKNRLTASLVGVMLIILGVVFHIMVIISMKEKTATSYGAIPMITIATFTFSKITMAAITAFKHRGNSARLYKSINAIRYSEVAVSLLTMQQSMLVSFEGMDKGSSVILNALTGAGVCFFILALGIRLIKSDSLTLKQSRKENK